MTEYQLVDLWSTHLMNAMTLFVAFLSATSALVVVAHLKGSVLDNAIYRLIFCLYSVAAVFFILLYSKLIEAALDLRGQMHDADLSWFNTVYEPQIVAPFILGLGAIVQVMLAIGSLWYFKKTRKP